MADYEAKQGAIGDRDGLDQWATGGERRKSAAGPRGGAGVGGVIEIGRQIEYRRWPMVWARQESTRKRG